MIFFKKYSVLILILISLNTYAQNKDAETPKALLLQSAQAMEILDYAKIKSFYYIKNEQDSININALISVLKLVPEVQKFLKKGHEKFGDDFNEALSYAEFILNGLASPPDYKAAYQSGKITVKGSKAEVLLSHKSNDGVTMSQKISLIKVKNKWFYLADNKEMPMVYNSLNEFIIQGTTALDESKTPQQLHDKFEKLLGLFKDF